jgi:hypothetical protein
MGLVRKPQATIAQKAAALRLRIEQWAEVSFPQNPVCDLAKSSAENLPAGVNQCKAFAMPRAAY